MSVSKTMRQATPIITHNLTYSNNEYTLQPDNSDGYVVFELYLQRVKAWQDFNYTVIADNIDTFVSYSTQSSHDGVAWGYWNTGFTCPAAKYLRIRFDLRTTDGDKTSRLQDFVLTFDDNIVINEEEEWIKTTQGAATDVDAKVEVELKNQYWSGATELDTRIKYPFSPMDASSEIQALDFFKIDDDTILALVPFDKYPNTTINGNFYGLKVYSFNPKSGAISGISSDVTGIYGVTIGQPARINKYKGENGDYWVTFVSGLKLISAKSTGNWNSWSQTVIYDAESRYDVSNPTDMNHYHMYLLTNGTEWKCSSQFVINPTWESDVGTVRILDYSGFYYLSRTDYSPGIRLGDFIQNGDSGWFTLSFVGKSITLKGSARTTCHIDAYKYKNGGWEWATSNQYQYDGSLDVTVDFGNYNTHIVKLVVTSSGLAQTDTLSPITGTDYFTTYISDLPWWQWNWGLSNWDFQKGNNWLYLGAKQDVIYNNGWQSDWKLDVHNLPHPYNLCGIYRIEYDVVSDVRWWDWEFRCYTDFGFWYYDTHDDPWCVVDRSSHHYNQYVQAEWDAPGFIIGDPVSFIAFGLRWHTNNGIWTCRQLHPDWEPAHVTLQNIKTYFKPTHHSPPYRYKFESAEINAEWQASYAKNTDLIFNDAYISVAGEMRNTEFISDALLIGYWDGYGSADEALNSANQIDFSLDPAPGDIENTKIWVKWFSTDVDCYNFREFPTWDGEPGPEKCVAWMMVYVYNPSAGDSSYILKYGVDDGVKIYSVKPDGTVTLEDTQTGERDMQPDEFPNCAITLGAGWNKLYFKVSNGTGTGWPNRWSIKARIVDANDKLPDGMIISTTKSTTGEIAYISLQSKEDKAIGYDFTETTNSNTIDKWSRVHTMGSIKEGTKSGYSYSSLEYICQDYYPQSSEKGNIMYVQYDIRANIPADWHVEIYMDAVLKTEYGSGYYNLTDRFEVSSTAIGAGHIGFALKYWGAGTSSPGDISQCYVEIFNIKCIYSQIQTGMKIYSYLWVNWGGDCQDWESPAFNKRYKLWESVGSYPERGTFLTLDNSLWMLAQHWEDGLVKLKMHSLDSTILSSPDYWSSVDTGFYRPLEGIKKYFTNLNWEASRYNQFFICSDFVNNPDGNNFSRENGFFTTHHPEWISSPKPAFTNEMIIAFIPIGDSMMMLSTAGDGLIRKRMLGESTTRYDISNWVTDFTISKTLEGSSDNASITLNNVGGEFNPISASGMFREIIPEAYYDRKPRIFNIYMSSHSADEQPYFSRITNTDPDHNFDEKRVFTGVLGQIENSASYEDNSLPLSIYDFSYQLNKFNAPESYVYASPPQVFFDDFCDSYAMGVSDKALSIRNYPDSTIWVESSNNSAFSIDPYEKYMEHIYDNYHYICTKNFPGNFSATLACSIKMPTFCDFTLWWSRQDFIRFYPASGFAAIYDSNGVDYGHFDISNMIENDWNDIKIAVGPSYVDLSIRNTSKGRVYGRGYSAGIYCFLWGPSAHSYLRSPRITKSQTGLFEKTDTWIVKDVLYKAAQHIIPVNETSFMIPENEEDVLIGFIVWREGESAYSFLDRLSKRYNKRFYFDNLGRIIWKNQELDLVTRTLESKHIESVRQSYSNFDYVNWIGVYSDNNGSPIKGRAGSAESIMTDGTRYELVEDGSFKTRKDANLKAAGEYYSRNDGLEVLSCNLTVPLFTVRPGDLIKVSDPEVTRIESDYIIRGTSFSYNNNDKSWEIGLEMDSRIKALREGVGKQILGTFI
ncbi:MAG: hypothetical protein WC476_01195 [Phycisphaerae bacterium]|jgi:hypothetical protein